MSEPYLGSIVLFPYNFAPRGWAFCNGQVMPIAQNTALFSLLGTTYGGNGQTTFNLPDLRGRVPNGAGQGPGLQNYDLGEVNGNETFTLLTTQLPAHNHVIDLTNLAATIKAKNGAGNSATPIGNVPAIEAAGVTATYSSATPDGVMKSDAVTISGVPNVTGITGGSQPISLIQPFLTLHYCIALEGIYPSRN